MTNFFLSPILWISLALYVCHMQLSKEHGGIMRFIQLSCLGASKSSSSRMLQAKAAAEESILRELPEVSHLFDLCNN